MARKLDEALLSFSKHNFSLPGIQKTQSRNTLVAQLVESWRRVEYVQRLRQLPLSQESSDPKSSAFNPIKAALYHRDEGRVDEAFWLVFLLTHFGKHPTWNWELTRAVYGKLGEEPIWDWVTISSGTIGFRTWLRNNQQGLRHLSFGNHRKYETLRENSTRGLADVIEAYVSWVGIEKSHETKVAEVLKGTNDPEIGFELMFDGLSQLHRWGRLAKFDHLTMLAKLGLLNIRPGRAFLKSATGPKRGASLLLMGDVDAPIEIDKAESLIRDLGDTLGLGQQEMEDALCNWQKSPEFFVPFR